MVHKLWKSAVFFLGFLHTAAFSEPIHWVNAEQSQNYQVNWQLSGDFYLVDVLVNGHAPFTCAMVETTHPLIQLGENGECDIRSASLDGEITVIANSFNQVGEHLGTEEITLMKDTVAPEIHWQDGKLSVVDSNLDLNTVECSFEGAKLESCSVPTESKGTLRVKASDYAGNQTSANFEMPEN